MRIRVLVMAVAVLVAACADPGTSDTSTTTTTALTTDAQLAELDAARTRWSASAPGDYTMRVTTASAESVYAVKDGQVVSLDGQSVDAVFDTIEASIHGGASVEVEYDPELGYPIRLIIDLDGDGGPDIELELSDVEAMPIVQTLDEFYAAQARWEALGLDTYRYILHFACDCPLVGTYEVEIRDGREYATRPLDGAAEETGELSRVSLDALFDDLERWFTSAEELVPDEIVAVVVRMDPELGYPRWISIEASGIEDEWLPEEFTLVATVDLIEINDPGEPGSLVSDRRKLDMARITWAAAAVVDYDFAVTFHCECPPESRGPFAVSVRDGQTVSAEGPIGRIEDAFGLIDEAIDAGVDVDVTYDETLGYPVDVIIDPEAVAVDGGLAFTISDFER